MNTQLTSYFPAGGGWSITKTYTLFGPVPHWPSPWNKASKGHHNNPTPVQLHRLDYSRRLLKATQVVSFLCSPAKQHSHIDSIQLPVVCLCQVLLPNYNRNHTQTKTTPQAGCLWWNLQSKSVVLTTRMPKPYLTQAVCGEISSHIGLGIAIMPLELAHGGKLVHEGKSQQKANRQEGKENTDVWQWTGVTKKKIQKNCAPGITEFNCSMNMLLL